MWTRGETDFLWRVSSISSTRPAAAMGTSVTPAQNAKGSWSAAILSNTAEESCLVHIGINAAAANATAKDCIVDIGVDPANGTSYSVVIPDLLASCAGPYSVYSGGLHYWFPLRIPKGSSIAARASVNNATVGTLNVIVRLMGRPRNVLAWRTGSKVVAYGITAASSRGTTVTAGTTSEGTWTLLGSPAECPWFWQVGFGCNDSTMSALQYHMDLGIGSSTSNVRVVFEDILVHSNASEQVGIVSQPGGWMTMKDGENVYGRLQCSGTADSGLSMAAYGVV